MISNEETFLPDFFSSSEAIASELLENPVEMFPQYYIDSDICSMLKYSITSI